MTPERSDRLWVPTFTVLVALAVPWPLWGVDLVVAGLPVWIWWHVGWLGLCSAAFYAFVESGAWERGMGRSPVATDVADGEERAKEGTSP